VADGGTDTLLVSEIIKDMGKGVWRDQKSPVGGNFLALLM
jgi:hypothetical protein